MYVIQFYYLPIEIIFIGIYIWVEVYFMSTQKIYSYLRYYQWHWSYEGIYQAQTFKVKLESIVSVCVVCYIILLPSHCKYCSCYLHVGCSILHEDTENHKLLEVLPMTLELWSNLPGTNIQGKFRQHIYCLWCMLYNITSGVK